MGGREPATFRHRGPAWATAFAVMAMVFGGEAATQQTADAQAEMYRFIEEKAFSDAVMRAGQDGYGILSLARCPSQQNSVIMKRDGAGARIYRTIDTVRLPTFMRELNEAGEQGFRFIPGATQAPVGNHSHWAAVLERYEGHRFTYVDVAGDEEGAAALNEGAASQMNFVGVLSRRVIFERSQPALAEPAAQPGREYRIVATARTGTLEAEIQAAAAEGFRILQSGWLRVVMARDRGAAAPPVEYRLIAMTRATTAERELRQAAAEGFRIVTIPECTSEEGMFILQRSPGASARFDYQVVTLSKTWAAGWLEKVEAAGFRVVQLFNRIVVLERTVVP